MTKNSIYSTQGTPETQNPSNTYSIAKNIAHYQHSTGSSLYKFNSTVNLKCKINADFWLQCLALIKSEKRPKGAIKSIFNQIFLICYAVDVIGNFSENELVAE